MYINMYKSLMFSRMKKWMLFFFFISACLAIPSGAKRLTRGFKVAKMRLEFPFRSDLNGVSELSDEEAKIILAQPFSFLNKGAQCYAFLSQDGKYVLKLFRFDQRLLIGKKRSKRSFEQKVCGFFESCKLASISASNETGVLYLHLNLTAGKLPMLIAKGPLGRSFHLPLDRCRFALQKKAMPLAEGLFTAMEEGQLSERIEAIVALLENRIAKGIGNSDPSLWRNFGFWEDRAIEFDFGNYIARPDFSDVQRKKAELERYMHPLRVWLEKYAPDYLSDLDRRVLEARL